MSLFKVSGIGTMGVITDVAPQELPPNVWTSATNIRFYNGQVQNMLQNTEVLTDDSSPSSKPDVSVNYAQALLGYFVSDDTIFYATGNQIYSYASGVHTNRSSLSSPYGVSTSAYWTSLVFNNSIVFTNPSSIPQILVPTDNYFVDMPAWDANWTCESIVAYKNFLFALNTTESSVEYRQRLRWSDAAAPNEAPISWDAADPTKLAGFNDLTDATGVVVAAKTISDTLFVYTTEEIFAVQYVGGASLFNFRKVNADIGALNSNCVAQYKNGHVVMGKDNVYIFDGSQVTSIIDGKIRDDFFHKLNKQYSDFIKIITNPQYNEVWICYPNDNSISGEINAAAVWNSVTGAWSYRDFIPNAVSITNVRRPAPLSAKWIDATYSWSDSRSNFAWLPRDYGSDILLASTTDGTFVMLDQAQAGLTPIVSTLERRYIDLDDAGAQSTGVKSISSIYPQIGGTGTLYFYIGMSDYIGGPITWSEPKSFIIGSTNRVDFRASGRYISLRVVCSSVDSQWFFTGYDIEFSARFKGRRSS